MSRKIKGNSPDTAIAVNSLATLFDDMDEFAKAEPLHLEAINIFRQAAPETHHNDGRCDQQPRPCSTPAMGQYPKP